MKVVDEIEHKKTKNTNKQTKEQRQKSKWGQEPR